MWMSQWTLAGKTLQKDRVGTRMRLCPDVDVVAAVTVVDVRPEIRHFCNQNVLAAHEVLFDVANMFKLLQLSTARSCCPRTSSDTCMTIVA